MCENNHPIPKIDQTFADRLFQAVACVGHQPNQPRPVNTVPLLMHVRDTLYAPVRPQALPWTDQRFAPISV
jgi:hypothetical protein